MLLKVIKIRRVAAFFISLGIALAHSRSSLADNLETPYQPPALQSIHISASGSPGFGDLFGGSGVLASLASTEVVAQSDVAAAISDFYNSAKRKLLWIDGDGPSLGALQALSIMSHADELGLEPRDYVVDRSYEGQSAGSQGRRGALARFEVTMSASFLMFSQDNYRGRINPNGLSDYYDFKRKPTDLPKILTAMSSHPDIVSFVRSITPGGAKFLQLASELQRLRSRSPSPAISGKIDKVIVAMEQLRWLPDGLGSRYVFINQPAFMAYYHENDSVKLSMKTVIAQAGHQTYFFQGTIETVEFNPDWIVPQSIVVNEMMTKLRKDPSYLDRAGYKVSVKGQPTRSVNVDWSQPIDNIEVVQPPGPDNALGQLKILFPNRQAIYMHDTPAKNKFAMEERMFSHGCVRLANPRGMAAAVLGTTVEDVSAAIADGKTIERPVSKRFPVYVTYFTAWPNEDGTLQFFDDVYGRDALTLAAMAATSAQRSASTEVSRL